MTFPRIAAFAVVAALAAACSPTGGSYGQAAVPQPQAAAVQAKPLTVEQLAAKVGCKPHIQVDAVDIRTGHCKTKDGQFFVSTFTTQAGKDAWMDTAPEYNPHLVGNLWTVLSSRKVLDRLRVRLGGDLHLKDHRTHTPTPTS